MKSDEHAELREKVARELAKLVECDWENFQPSIKAEFYSCADQILNFIKDAGYVKLSPDAAILEGVHHLKDI